MADNPTISNLPGNERYFSFGVGMVHFVAVSTDESIDAESTQGQWFKVRVSSDEQLTRTVSEIVGLESRNWWVVPTGYQAEFMIPGCAIMQVQTNSRWRRHCTEEGYSCH